MLPQAYWQLNVPSACCSKIAEAEAAVSVNEKKCLVMHMHVQLKLDELHQLVSSGAPLSHLLLISGALHMAYPPRCDLTHCLNFKAFELCCVLV
jgi:hypothetical protein